MKMELMDFSRIFFDIKWQFYTLSHQLVVYIPFGSRKHEHVSHTLCFQRLCGGVYVFIYILYEPLPENDFGAGHGLMVALSVFTGRIILFVRIKHDVFWLFRVATLQIHVKMIASLE